MSRPSTSFEDLAAILAEETAAHELLLDAAQKMNAAARERDLEGVRAQTTRLDEQAVYIEQIEARRAACCTALGRTLDPAHTGATRLAAIITQAPPAIRERLTALRTALKRSIGKISAVNIANRILLADGIRFAHRKLDRMARAGTAFVHYRQGGASYAAGITFHPFINRTV